MPKVQYRQEDQQQGPELPMSDEMKALTKVPKTQLELGQPDFLIPGKRRDAKKFNRYFNEETKPFSFSSTS